MLAVAALLAGFGVALPRFLTHGPYPRLGVNIGAGGVVQRVLGPPARGLLVPGDRLLTLNGLSLDDSLVRARLSSEGWPRGTLELEFERDGVLRHVPAADGARVVGALPARIDDRSWWPHRWSCSQPGGGAPDLGTAFLWYAASTGWPPYARYSRMRRTRPTVFRGYSRSHARWSRSTPPACHLARSRAR
jgi:hypothetical protein